VPRPKKHAVGTARKALLSAACTLFAQRGFEGASTHEIARHAHVPQGLVRHHFGSKEALWLEVVRGRLGDLNARLAPADAGRGLPAESAATWAEALCEQRELIQLVLHALLEPGTRRSWLISELSASAPARALIAWARASNAAPPRGAGGAVPPEATPRIAGTAPLEQAAQLTDHDLVLICVRTLGVCGVSALVPVLEIMRGRAIDPAAVAQVLRDTFDDALRVTTRGSVAGPWSLAAAAQRRSRAANAL
jgi:AcrR family transcriptional regulator